MFMVPYKHGQIPERILYPFPCITVNQSIIQKRSCLLFIQSRIAVGFSSLSLTVNWALIRPLLNGVQSQRQLMKPKISKDFPRRSFPGKWWPTTRHTPRSLDNYQTRFVYGSGNPVAPSGYRQRGPFMAVPQTAFQRTNINTRPRQRTTIIKINRNYAEFLHAKIKKMHSWELSPLSFSSWHHRKTGDWD